MTYRKQSTPSAELTGQSKQERQESGSILLELKREMEYLRNLCNELDWYSLGVVPNAQTQMGSYHPLRELSTALQRQAYCLTTVLEKLECQNTDGKKQKKAKGKSKSESRV